MSDPAKLVNEAAAQVAAYTVRLEYWENLAEPWGTDPLPETLAQGLAKARHDLAMHVALWRRLKEAT